MLKEILQIIHLHYPQDQESRLVILHVNVTWPYYNLIETKKNSILIRKSRHTNGFTCQTNLLSRPLLQRIETPKHYSGKSVAKTNANLKLVIHIHMFLLAVSSHIYYSTQVKIPKSIILFKSPRNKFRQGKNINSEKDSAYFVFTISGFVLWVKALTISDKASSLTSCL